MCFKKEEVESKLTRKKVNFLKVLCGDLQSTVNEIKKKISFYFSYTSFYFLHQFPYLFPSYTTAKLIDLELLIKTFLNFIFLNDQKFNLTFLLYFVPLLG